jgi:hypothetical protein
MMRLAVIVLCLAIGGTSWAQQLGVQYVEGEVSARQGSGWVRLAAGDQVSADTTVRVGASACVELKAPAVSLILNRLGIYSLRDILAARTRFSGPRVGRALSAAFTQLFTANGRGARGTATQGGGRAGNAAEKQDKDEEWDLGSADQNLRSGRRLAEAGKVDEAIASFLKVVRAPDDAEAAQLREARYMLASAYCASGNTLEAVRWMNGLEPLPEDAWLPDCVLLKARLLLDTSDYGAAVDALKPLEAMLAADPQRAAAFHFLLALGYRGLGDIPREIERLKATQAAAGPGDVAAAAAELLANP